MNDNHFVRQVPIEQAWIVGRMGYTEGNQRQIDSRHAENKESVIFVSVLDGCCGSGMGRGHHFAVC